MCLLLNSAATTDQESVVYDPPTDTDTLLGNRKGCKYSV